MKFTFIRTAPGAQEPRSPGDEERESLTSEEFDALGNSNWTICSPLSHFCSENFHKFSLSYWEANSHYPIGLVMRRGGGGFSDSRNKCDRGFGCLGAGTFKLDHLHPLKPLLF